MIHPDDIKRALACLAWLREQAMVGEAPDRDDGFIIQVDDRADVIQRLLTALAQGGASS
jgi:hypothetical protein